MNPAYALPPVVVATAIIFAPMSARAAFSLLDNFDTLSVAALGTQGGWTSNSVANVISQVGSDNAVRLSTGGTGNLSNYKALGGLVIANSNASSTVYFNFSTSSGTGNNFNFILTDQAAPANTGDNSEVQLNTDNSAPAGGSATFRANSGNTFQYLSTVAGDVANTVPITANTQYNVWFVINNITDIYQIYMQNSGIPSLAAGPTQLFNAAVGGTGNFTFRNSGAGVQPNNLTTFNFGSGGTAGIVTVDDIYVDTSGQNLINPVPEPSLALLSVAGLLGICLRRSRPRR